MKKLFYMLIIMCSFFLLAGFTEDDFDIDGYDQYQKEYKSESIGACSASSTKTYEDYKGITAVGSAQYKYIHEHMTVTETGLLIDEDGFIGAALAYDFGPIGSRYYFEFDTGIVLPIVKVDAKSSAHTPNGCHAYDGSVIEFVIDTETALEYFSIKGNGLVNNGNFNNYKGLSGKIVDIEKVSDEKLEAGVTYEDKVVDDHTEIKEDTRNVINIEGGY
ncbi:MAG: hypothetical protein HUJ57_07900 [Erysipelotrichaceae bacterium]|nr:hypothetical protein [Erysipelotrichaceae bacterium]